MGETGSVFNDTPVLTKKTIFMQNLEFTLQGEGLNRNRQLVSRGQVQGYHNKPLPVNISGKAKKGDIAGLKKAQYCNLIESLGDYRSRFTIGFEVEKNSLHRGAVREYELFCGFEQDGSCGYEAVTHILPLVPASTWRNKVFDMMHKASRIIEDTFSPSNQKRNGHYTCGGHITLAVDGLDGDDLRKLVRINSGIVYALFRNRLNNSYCGYNKRMESYADCTNWHSKYQVALVKDNCLEFRLPSKFESVKQMIRRYELMHELVDFSVNKPNGSHETFLKGIRPIILSMYNGDQAKTDEILELARKFRKFILTGIAEVEIRQYL
jgi:hypothetical protein